MSNVKDGKLLAISPSMLSAFNPDTPFGCPRKGWFKYVMGLEEPSTGKQELGTALHALIEQRLTTGKRPEGEGEAYGLYVAGEKMIEEVAARKITGVEVALPAFVLGGAKLKGFVDVIHDRGIVDWKTTTDLARYGKTAEQLRTDTQLILYARACHPLLEAVQLAHGQFQTRGAKRTNLVEVAVLQESIDKQIDKVIIPQVEKIKHIIRETEPGAVDPDLRKCAMCAFKTQCPREGSAIMSFFNKLKDSDKVVPQTAAQTVDALQKSLDIVQSVLPPDAPKSESDYPAAVRAALDLGQGILPPDAPKSEPSLAADPVEAPAPKVTAPDAPKAKGRAKKSEPDTTPKATFKAVTVSRGCTINVGSFNSIRFDVSFTFEGFDPDDAFRTAYAACQARLDEEAAKYEAETAKGVTRNAKEVVSK